MDVSTKEFRLILPAELHQQVVEIAGRERRKVGAQLVVLLEQAVRHERTTAELPGRIEAQLAARQAGARA